MAGRMTAIKQRVHKVARGALIVVCVRDSILISFHISIHAHTLVSMSLSYSQQAMAEEASGSAAMDTVSLVPSLRWKWNK